MTRNENMKRRSRTRMKQPLLDTALRSAILAAPFVIAFLAIYAASGNEPRILAAIDKTITGSFQTTIR